MVSFTCTPKEVGLAEFGFDDKVACEAVVRNYNSSSVEVKAWEIVDGHEIESLGSKTISPRDSWEFSFTVKFNDALARQLYGPGATALDFLDSETTETGEKCERGVCYKTYTIQYLPHTTLGGSKSVRWKIIFRRNSHNNSKRRWICGKNVYKMVNVHITYGWFNNSRSNSCIKCWKSIFHYHKVCP